MAHFWGLVGPKLLYCMLKCTRSGDSQTKELLIKSPLLLLVTPGPGAQTLTFQGRSPHFYLSHHIIRHPLFTMWMALQSGSRECKDGVQVMKLLACKVLIIIHIIESVTELFQTPLCPLMTPALCRMETPLKETSDPYTTSLLSGISSVPLLSPIVLASANWPQTIHHYVQCWRMVFQNPYIAKLVALCLQEVTAN